MSPLMPLSSTQTHIRLGLAGVRAERYPYVFTSKVSFCLGLPLWDDFFDVGFHG